MRTDYDKTEQITDNPDVIGPLLGSVSPNFVVKPLGAKKKVKIDMKEARDGSKTAPASAEYIDHVDLFGFLGTEFSGSRSLRRVTSFSWVQCSEYKYLLECIKSDQIQVKKHGGTDLDIAVLFFYAD